MSHLYPTQRLITYPTVTAVEVLDTSSTEAEAELFLYFSRSAWSNALNNGKDTTLQPIADRIVQSSLEEQYLLLTEEDSPLYEIWKLQNASVLFSDLGLRSGLDPRQSDRDEGVRPDRWFDFYESDSDSHVHNRIVSISSSNSATSQQGREQSGSWSSSSSGSLYSQEKDPYQIDPISSFVEFSFDSLVLRAHEPVDLFDWIYKPDDSFGSFSHLEYLDR